jgi:hypothetical protein
MRSPRALGPAEALRDRRVDATSLSLQALLFLESMAAEIPSFDELVDLLRRRLAIADDLDDQTMHSFKTLMKEEADTGLVADHFYWRALEELEAQRHLDPKASGVDNGGDAHGRLSADGRLYLRTIDEAEGHVDASS